MREWCPVFHIDNGEIAETLQISSHVLIFGCGDQKEIANNEQTIAYQSFVADIIKQDLQHNVSKE